MALQNSSSLTDFQRNARAFIEDLNENRDPLLLTVNGKVKAVVVDPKTFEEMEEAAEKERFLAAIKEGLKDVEEGRTIPADEAFAQFKAKYNL